MLVKLELPFQSGFQPLLKFESCLCCNLILIADTKLIDCSCVGKCTLILREDMEKIEDARVFEQDEEN